MALSSFTSQLQTHMFNMFTPEVKSSLRTINHRQILQEHSATEITNQCQINQQKHVRMSDAFIMHNIIPLHSYPSFSESTISMILAFIWCKNCHVCNMTSDGFFDLAIHCEKKVHYDMRYKIITYPPSNQLCRHSPWPAWLSSALVWSLLARTYPDDLWPSEGPRHPLCWNRKLCNHTKIHDGIPSNQASSINPTTNFFISVERSVRKANIS